jgi:hypothetical protein
MGHKTLTYIYICYHQIDIGLMTLTYMNKICLHQIDMNLKTLTYMNTIHLPTLDTYGP